jgi:hypothetical protein
MVQHFGEEWLNNGYAECRLLKPVYDGAKTEIIGDPLDNSLSLVVESLGERCATGIAKLAASSSERKRIDFQEVELPEFEKRPQASKTSLPIGKMLENQVKFLKKKVLSIQVGSYVWRTEHCR